MDRAWLAGLWDGEGSVGIYRQVGKKYADPDSNIIWVPSASIEMTDKPTIDRVVELIEELGCSYLRTEMTERNARWRDTSKLRIRSYWSVSALGYAIEPYSVTKRKHWQLILEYMESRVQRLGGYTENGYIRTRGRYVDRLYTPEELEMIERIRKMNRGLEGPDEPKRRGPTANVSRRMG